MSKKSKKTVKPAAPQVKRTIKSSSAKAKPVGTKLVKKAVAPTKKAAPPKPVTSTAKSPKKPLTSPAITSAAAAAGSAARSRGSRAPATPASHEGITITAQIDVGFGNLLFLRGEGGSLAWDAGVQMECAFDDQWTIKLTPVYGPVTFKFLINDLTWSSGENYTLQPGASVVLTPEF